MGFLKHKNSFKISEISKKEFCRNSLCPQDYKELILNNSNTIKLSDIIEDWYKGEEIGSDNYMKNSNFRFLKTVNITKSFLYNQTSIEYCKPNFGKEPQENDIFIVKDGAGSGLGEVALYRNKSKYSDYISAGLIGIRIQKDKRYYTLSFLKSQHFKDYVNVNTAQGSTIRHSKLIALNYPVAFPTTKNHQQTKLVTVHGQ